MSKATPRGPRAPLARDGVVEAALALLDDEGPEGFSMRKLGAALGVEAMAVYHYFPSKAHLFDAVVERMMAEVVVPGPEAGGPLARVEAAARSYRAMGLRHPRAFVLLATRRFRAEGPLRFLDGMLALLAELGFPPAGAAAMFRLLGFFLNGACLGDQAIAEPVDGARPGAAHVDPDTLPHVARAAAFLGPEHLDDNFDAGLAAVLAHLARAAPATRASSRRASR